MHQYILISHPKIPRGFLSLIFSAFSKVDTRPGITSFRRMGGPSTVFRQPQVALLDSSTGAPHDSGVLLDSPARGYIMNVTTQPGPAGRTWQAEP
jgi:hypothetical protein